MKKLPLVFCYLLLSCSSQKETVNNERIFVQHKQPYRVSTIGKWNDDYQIYTLIDANDMYFTVKVPTGRKLKKGDIFTQ